MIDEPTILDFLDTARKATVVADGVADFNRGSDYESLAGPNAILWSRQTQRDTDLWYQTRFANAQGEQLTDLVLNRYGITRVLDARGTGIAILTRPSSGGGAGTVWEGTRIRAETGPFGVPIYFRVTQDVSVAATLLLVTVPIEAVNLGPGSKITASTQNFIDDTLWDSTWTADRVDCTDGTELEPAGDFRTRVQALRLAARVGQEQALINTCILQGAQVVQLFRSDYSGEDEDVGLNWCYVGDLGYTATPELVRACILALRATRVAGDNLQVLPLGRATLPIDVDIYLRDEPGVMPTDRLEIIHRKALIQYLNGPGGRFSYTTSGLESAIAKTGTEVQDVQLVTPTVDAPLAPGSAVLTRYFADDNDITIRYHGPE